MKVESGSISDEMDTQPWEWTHPTHTTILTRKAYSVIFVFRMISPLPRHKPIGFNRVETDLLFLILSSVFCCPCWKQVPVSIINNILKSANCSTAFFPMLFKKTHIHNKNCVSNQRCRSRSRKFQKWAAPATLFLTHCPEPYQSPRRLSLTTFLMLLSLC